MGQGGSAAFSSRSRLQRPEVCFREKRPTGRIPAFAYGPGLLTASHGPNEFDRSRESSSRRDLRAYRGGDACRFEKRLIPTDLAVA
jgi:hypothetical protein